MTSRSKRALLFAGLLAAAAVTVIGSNQGTTTAAPTVSGPVQVQVINPPGDPANVKLADHGAAFNFDSDHLAEPWQGGIEIDFPPPVSPFEIENVNAVFRVEPNIESLRTLFIEVRNPDFTSSRRYIPFKLQSSYAGYDWYVANEAVTLSGQANAVVRMTLQRSAPSSTPMPIYVSVGGHYLQ